MIFCEMQFLYKLTIHNMEIKREIKGKHYHKTAPSLVGQDNPHPHKINKQVKTFFNYSRTE